MLRELTVDDWPALREMRLHALSTEPGLFFSNHAREAAHTDEQWIALASGDDQHQLFGVFDGARMVGMSGVFTDRDDPSGRTAALGMSFILPEYRRRGLAARLYEVRLAWARSRPQFERAVIGHRLSNTASRRNIERFGFQWTRNKPHCWTNGDEEDHVAYELRLRDIDAGGSSCNPASR